MAIESQSSLKHATAFNPRLFICFTEWTGVGRGQSYLANVLKQRLEISRLPAHETKATSRRENKVLAHQLASNDKNNYRPNCRLEAQLRQGNLHKLADKFQSTPYQLPTIK